MILPRRARIACAYDRSGAEHILREAYILEAIRHAGIPRVFDCGTLETGRVLDYTDRGDDQRRLCSLYLSIMDRMSVRLDRFGDAESRLDRL